MTTVLRFPRALFALLALTLGLTAFVSPADPAEGAATQGITGVVTLVDKGARPALVTVDPVDPAAAPLAFGGELMTEDDGTFSLGLPPGQYWVRFSGVIGAAPEWWGDSPTREGSTPVTVESGSLTSLEPELEPGGAISGTIAQAESGGAYPDGLVEVLAPDSTFPDGYFRMALGLTDENGDYEVSNLPTGSYLVHIYTRNTLLEGWWGNATTAAASTPVAVTAPGTVTGISPTQLVPQGHVSGTLTNAVDGKPFAGAYVDLFYRDEDGRFRQRGWSHTFTDAQGAYSLQVPTGTYRIRFYAVTDPGTYPMRPEYWNDVTDLSSAQDVTVAIVQNALADAVLEPSVVVNLTPPTVKGTARVGSTLTATTGAWYPGSRSLTYQWFRRGVGAIAGAVHRTYVPRPADVGRYLRVRVTASATGYGATPVSSWAPERVARGLFKLLSEPAITGRLRVGETLHATPPRSQPSAGLVRYQWRRNGVAIPGATSARYELVRADRARRISVRITLTRSGYVPVTRIVTRATLVR